MSSLLVKIVIRLAAWLPLPWLQRLAVGIGAVLAGIPNDLRRITRINLRLCFPEKNETERNQLARHSINEAVKTFLELGPVWFWSKQRMQSLIHKVHGEAQLQQAIAAGHGVVLAVPHLGMWEIIGQYCSIHYPMTSLFRPSPKPALDRIMMERRERFGASLVPTSTSGVRALYQALARGELIAVLPDQEPRWGNGVFAPFFGIDAYTMTLLPRLASKNGAAVVLAWACRLSDGGGYEVYFRLLPGACGQQDLLLAAQCLNREMESCIRQWPEQYQWSYKRFRTGPDGKPYEYYRQPD